MGRIWGNAKGGWRLQRRDSKGRFQGKRGGATSYVRKGVGHSTVGLNAGTRISLNRRVSAGFYIRTETRTGQKRAQSLAKKQEFAQLGVASRLPVGGERTLGGNLKRVKRAQSKVLRKTVGGEHKLGGDNNYARIGTDRNGLPTVIVQHGKKHDKRGNSYKRRNSAITAYNTNSVTGKRTYDWTQGVKRSRPQRRKKYSYANNVI